MDAFFVYLYLVSLLNLGDHFSVCWVDRRKRFATDRIHPFIVDKYLEMKIK